MRPFMDENFLLNTDTARILYHDAARDMPIIDYHCHLSPKEIAENVRFSSITQLMLGGDHYKWRMMLSDGVDEALIRGAGEDFARFYAFAKSLRRAIGNPLYHWTHLELKRVFGIDTPLNEYTAREIYDRANALLKTDEFRAQALIDKFNVDYLCTTDDPIDDLTYHRSILQEGTLRARVLPAFRPDKAINVDRAGFKDYVKMLESAAQMRIHNTRDMIAALARRVDYFNACGARIADHALDTVPFGEMDFGRADKAFAAALKGETPKPKQVESYRTLLLVALGEMYVKRGWVQQYHIGAMRNNNTRYFEQYGADVGFDSVEDAPFARALSRLLDAQDRRDLLPKTILYTLNPAGNMALATMLGNFQAPGVKGKMQMGSGWWFLDQRDGMVDMLRVLGNEGMLANFVGMLTDSRSFISYPRHEYFRRVLCAVIGDMVEKGEYPNDVEFLKGMVRDIAYNNAKEYFGI